MYTHTYDHGTLQFQRRFRTVLLSFKHKFVVCTEQKQMWYIIFIQFDVQDDYMEYENVIIIDWCLFSLTLEYYVDNE